MKHKIDQCKEWGFTEEELNTFEDFKINSSNNTKDHSKGEEEKLIKFEAFDDLVYLPQDSATVSGENIMKLLKEEEKKLIKDIEFLNKKRNEGDLNEIKKIVLDKINDLYWFFLAVKNEFATIMILPNTSQYNICDHSLMITTKDQLNFVFDKKQMLLFQC